MQKKQQQDVSKNMRCHFLLIITAIENSLKIRKRAECF